MDNNKYSIWQSLNKKYNDIPDYPAFEKWLATPENKRTAYELMSKKYYDVEEAGYEEFEKYIDGSYQAESPVESQEVFKNQIKNPSSKSNGFVDDVMNWIGDVNKFVQDTPLLDLPTLDQNAEIGRQIMKILPSIPAGLELTSAGTIIGTKAMMDAGAMGSFSPRYIGSKDAELKVTPEEKKAEKEKENNVYERAFKHFKAAQDIINDRYGYDPSKLDPAKDIGMGLGTSVTIMGTSLIGMPALGFHAGAAYSAISLGSDVYEMTGDVEKAKAGMAIGYGLGLTEAIPILNGMKFFKSDKIFKAVGKEMLEEMGQEMFQTFGEEVSKDVLAEDKYDPTVGEYFKNVLYAGAIGGISGGLMSGPLAVTSRNWNVKQTKEAYKKYFNELVNKKVLSSEKANEFIAKIDGMSNAEVVNNMEMLEDAVKTEDKSNAVLNYLLENQDATIDEGFQRVFGQEEGNVLAQIFWTSPAIQAMYTNFIEKNLDVSKEAGPEFTLDVFKSNLLKYANSNPEMKTYFDSIVKLAVIERDRIIRDTRILGKMDVTKAFLFDDLEVFENSADVKKMREEQGKTIPEEQVKFQTKLNKEKEIEANVDYRLKIVDNIVSNLSKIKSWESNKSISEETLYKKIAELGIPKDQVELLKESIGDTIEEKLRNFIIDYNFPIEINTATTKMQSNDPYLADDDRDFGSGEIVPTQIYSDFTAKGGINYTENEISIPNITPVRRGHAEFSTSSGIGWFRSDEQKNNSEVRRINEIQSDLFQKERDTKDLAKPIFDETPEDVKKQSDFLQLLNKGNTWITVFIKSIIQDSARKGYKKVLFPTGDTAGKIEGHETLEEFKKQKENKIEGLEKNLKVADYKTSYFAEFVGTNSKGEDIFEEGFWKYDEMTGAPFRSYTLEEVPEVFEKRSEKEKKEFVEKTEREINALKEELKRIETEGFAALRPIYNFYENTVFNILKKQGYNPKQITDEHNQTWYEVEIKPSRDLETIKFQTEQQFNKPIAIPQNLASGIEAFGQIQQATPEVKEKLGETPHSIDMIIAGLRTRTTRSAKEMEKYNVKVGDIIPQYGRSADGTTKQVLTRVTAIHPKGTEGYLGTWDKEGWTPEGIEAIKRYKDGAAAIEFEVVGTTYKGIKVEDNSNIVNAEGTKGAGQYSSSTNTIRIDREFLRQKFEEKAWTNPRELKEALGDQTVVSKADALPEDQFKTYEEWENFFLEHEYQHSVYSREDFNKEFPNGTKGQYESEINRRALAELSKQPVQSMPQTENVPQSGSNVKFKYIPDDPNLKKGSPEGDAKDAAMRKVADGFIGELDYGSYDKKLKGGLPDKGSSTLTSYMSIFNKRDFDDTDLKGDETKDGFATLSIRSGAKTVLLARNGVLKEKPLKEDTKRYMKEVHEDGAEFVVGDMPGVDSQFIDYLNEIGAKYTVYSTSPQPRIQLQRPVETPQIRTDMPIGAISPVEATLSMVPAETPVREPSIDYFRGNNLNPELKEFGDWALDYLIKDKVRIEFVDKNYLIGGRIPIKGRAAAYRKTKSETVIYVNRDAHQDNGSIYRSIVHEAIHHIFNTQVGLYAPFRAKLDTFYKNVKNRIQNAEEGSADYEFYQTYKSELDVELEDAEEMTAYIMSNTSVLNLWARRTQYDLSGKEKGTFLDKFKKLVKEVLGRVGLQSVTYKQVLDTLLEEQFGSPNPLMFKENLKQMFEAYQENDYGIAYKDLLANDIKFENPKTADRVGKMLGKDENGFLPPDGIAYLQGKSEEELYKSLFNSKSWLEQTEILFESNFQYKDYFEKRYLDKWKRGLTNPYTGSYYQNTREGRLEDFRNYVFNNLLTMVNSVVKTPHIRPVNVSSEPLAPNIYVEELGNTFKEYNSNSYKNSYIFKTRLHDQVKKLSLVLGINFDLVAIDTFVNRDGEGTDETVDAPMFSSEADIIDIMQSILNEGYYYLGNFADKNTTFALKPSAKLTQENIDKLNKLREFYQKKILDFSSAWQINPAYLEKDFLQSDPFLLRIILEDMRYGATFNQNGEILNSALFDPNNPNSGDGLKIFKRPYDVASNWVRPANTTRNSRILKNVRSKSGISIDNNGNFEFNTAIFNSKDKTTMIMFEGKEIPLSDLLLTEEGTERTDGIIYYLQGGFGDVYRQYHDVFLDGAIKAHTFNDARGEFNTPLFLKASFQLVSVDSPIGRWMTQNNLALLASSSAAKVAEGVKRVNLLTKIDSGSSIKIPMHSIHRIGEKGKYDMKAKGLLQSLSSNFIVTENSFVPKNALEALNKAISGILQKTVGNYEDKMAKFTPSEMIAYLRSAVEEETSAYSKTIAEIVLAITYNESDYNKYNVQREDDYVKSYEEELRDLVISEGYGDLFSGLMNDPYFVRFLQGYVWKQIDKIINYQAPGSHVVIRPDIGFLDAPVAGLTALSQVDETEYNEAQLWLDQYNEEFEQLGQTIDESKKKIAKKMQKKVSDFTKFKETETYIEEAFDENMKLNKGWVVLSAGWAELYNLKVGDKIILTVTPSTNIRSQIPVRIAAFGKNTSMEEASVKGNAYEFQTINGRDFDIDVLHMMPFSEKFFTREQYDFYWNMLKESHKLHEKKTLATYKKVLGGDYIEGFGSGAEITEKDLSNQKVQIAFMQKILGLSELSSASIIPVSFAPLLGKYVKKIGNEVSRKKLATTMAQIGMSMKAFGYTLEANVSDEAYIMHELATNHIVDAPNNTSSMFYNTDDANIDAVTYDGRGMQGAWVDGIADVLGIPSYNVVPLFNGFLKYWFRDALALTKDNNIDDPDAKIDVPTRLKYIARQQYKNTLLRALSQPNSEELKKSIVADMIAKNYSGRNIRKIISKVGSFYYALLDGMTEINTDNSPLLKAIDSIDLTKVPNMFTSLEEEQGIQDQIAQLVLEENKNVLEAVQTANPFVKSELDRLEKTTDPFTSNTAKAFALTLINNNLHYLKAKVIATIYPYKQAMHTIRKGQVGKRFLSEVFDSANVEVFPKLFSEIMKSPKVNEKKIKLALFGLDTTTAFNLANGSFKINIFKEDNRVGFGMNVKAGDPDAGIIWFQYYNNTVYVTYNKKGMQRPYHLPLNRLAIQKSETGRMLYDMLTNPDKGFWTSEKLFVWNQMFDISKSIDLSPKISIALEYIKNELNKFSDKEQKIFWESFMGYPNPSEGLKTIYNLYGYPSKELVKDNGVLYELAIKSELPSGKQFVSEYLKKRSELENSKMSYDIERQMTQGDMGETEIIKFQTDEFLRDYETIHSDTSFTVWNNENNVFDTIRKVVEPDVVTTNLDEAVGVVPNPLTAGFTPLSLRDLTAITKFNMIEGQRMGYSLEEVQFGIAKTFESYLDEIFSRTLSLQTSSIRNNVESMVDTYMVKEGKNPESLFERMKNTRNNLKKKAYTYITNLTEQNPMGLVITVSPDGKDVFHTSTKQNMNYEELKENIREFFGKDNAAEKAMLASVEIHKMLSVTNVKLINNMKTLLAEMLSKAESKDVKDTISGLLSKYEKITESFENMKFRYFPHVWEKKTWLAQMVEKGFSKKDAEKMYKEHITLNSQQDKGMMYSFMKRRLGIEGYEKDSLNPIMRHQSQLRRTIQNDMMSVLAKEYLYQAKSRSRTPKVISLMKGWFMLSSSSMAVRNTVITPDGVKQEDMIQFYYREPKKQITEEMSFEEMSEILNREDMIAAGLILEDMKLMKGKVIEVTDTTVTVGLPKEVTDQMEALLDNALEELAEYKSDGSDYGITGYQKAIFKKLGIDLYLKNQGIDYNTLSVQEAQSRIVSSYKSMLKRAKFTVNKNNMFTLDVKDGKEDFFRGAVRSIVPAKIEKPIQTLTAILAVLGIGGPSAGIMNSLQAHYSLWRDLKTKEMITRYFKFAGRGTEVFNRIVDQPEEIAKTEEAHQRASELLKKTELGTFTPSDKKNIYDYLDKIVMDYFLQNGLAIEAENLGISASKAVDKALFVFKLAELSVRRRAAYTYAVKAFLDGVTDPKDIMVAIEQGVARTQGLYTMIYRRIGERTGLGRFAWLFGQYTKIQAEVEKQNWEAAIKQWKRQTAKENLASLIPFNNRSLPTKNPNMVNKTSSQIYKDLVFFGINTIIPGFSFGNPVYKPVANILAIIFQLALFKTDFDDGEEFEKELTDLFWSLLALRIGMGVSVALNGIYSLFTDTSFRLFNTKVINGLGGIGLSIYDEYFGDKKKPKGFRSEASQSTRNMNMVIKTLTGVELVPSYHPFYGPRQAQSLLYSPFDAAQFSKYHLFSKEGFLETVSTFALPGYSSSKFSIFRDQKKFEKDLLKTRRKIRAKND